MPEILPEQYPGSGRSRPYPDTLFAQLEYITGLLLFGQQKYSDMVTREGKEKLLEDIVTDVNAILASLTDAELDGAVESAYFDTFVIQ